MDSLEERLALHLNGTPLSVLLRLRYVRERVWRAFCVDRALRPSKAAEHLAPRLLSMRNEPLALEGHVGNLIQIQEWGTALKARKDHRPASMRWWSARVKQVAAARPGRTQRLLRDNPDGIREL